MTNLPALVYKADDHAGGMHLSHHGEDATIIADKLSVLAKLAQVKASGFVFSGRLPRRRRELRPA